MGLETIASLQAVIGADVGGFNTGLDSVKNKLKGVGDSLSGFGTKLSLAFAPIALLGGKGIEAAATFEQSLAEISARAGLTAGELDKVRNFALKMGADTAFSTQDAADSMLNLLTAGMSTKEAMQALPAIMDAAAASGEGLQASSEMILATMNAWGTGAAGAKYIADIFARAAGASSASMADLGAGIANVGPVAKTFGMTVNDTAAALAVLNDNGIKGAEAGTNLKSMLLNMSATTAPVKAAWKELGVSMWDANGKARPLGDTMNDLRARMDGMNMEDKTRIAKALGGAYGEMGILALIGGDGLDGMAAKMEDSAGAADVAAKRMNTFKGRLESLKGSVETLMTNALTPFMNDTLKPLAERATVVVNKISDWAQKNPALVSTIARLVAGVGALGPVLMIAGKALALFSGPIGIISVAVGLLGAAFESNFLGIRDAVTNVWSQIAPLVSGFGRIFEQMFKDLSTGNIGGFIDGFLYEIPGLLTSIFQKIAGNVDLGPLTGLFDLIKGPFDNITGGIQGFVGSFASTDLSGVKSILSQIGLILGDLGTAISSVVRDASGWIGESLPKLGDGISGFVSNLGGVDLSGPRQILQIMGDALLTLTNTVGSTVSNVIGQISLILPNLATAIGDFSKKIGTADYSGVKKVLDAIGSALATIAGLLGSVVTGTLQGITNALPAFGDAISTFLSGMAAAGNGDIGGLLSRVAAGLLQMGLAAATIPYDIATKVGDFLGIDVQGGLAAWTGVKDNLVIILGEIKQQVETAVADVKKAWDAFWANPLGNLKSSFETAFTSAKSWIENEGKSWIEQAFNAVVSAVGGIIKGLAKPFIDAVAAGLKMIAELLHKMAGMPFIGPTAEDLANKLDALAGKAGGGSVLSSSTYLVGEKGPEIFRPSTGGSIIPNKALAGGGAGNGGTVTISIQSLVLQGVQDVETLLDELEKQAKTRNKRIQVAA